MKVIPPIVLLVATLSGCFDPAGIDCTVACPISAFDPSLLEAPFVLTFTPLAFGGVPGQIEVRGDWMLWMDDPQANRIGNRLLMQSSTRVLASNLQSGAMVSFEPGPDRHVMLPHFIGDGVVTLSSFRRCEACGSTAWGPLGMQGLEALEWNMETNATRRIPLPTSDAVVLDSSGPLRLLQFARGSGLFQSESGAEEGLAIWNQTSNRSVTVPGTALLWTQAADVPRTVTAGFHGDQLIVARVTRSANEWQTTVQAYDAEDGFRELAALPFSVLDAFPTPGGMFYWRNETTLAHEGIAPWQFSSRGGSIEFAYSTDTHVVWSVLDSLDADLYVHSFADNRTTKLGSDDHGPYSYPSGPYVYASVWRMYGGNPTAFVGRYNVDLAASLQNDATSQLVPSPGLP